MITAVVREVRRVVAAFWEATTPPPARSGPALLLTADCPTRRGSRVLRVGASPQEWLERNGPLYACPCCGETLICALAAEIADV